jgi:hypothetical protein
MDYSGNQLRAARALLGLDQAAFAKAVGAGTNTIKTMEGRGDEPVGGFASTRNRVREALEAMGIRFTNGDEPGVIWSRKGGKVAAGKGGGSVRVASKKAKQRKRKDGAK